MKDRENIGPSAKLTELFNSIPSNGDLSHGEMIEKRVKDLGEIFISKYTTTVPEKNVVNVCSL